MLGHLLLLYDIRQISAGPEAKGHALRGALGWLFLLMINTCMFVNTRCEMPHAFFSFSVGIPTCSSFASSLDLQN